MMPFFAWYSAVNHSALQICIMILPSSDFHTLCPSLQTILEEEYQDSIGMQGQKCQSLLLAYTATGAVNNSSVLCAPTPPGRAVELGAGGGGGGGTIKHGLHSAPFLSPCRATVVPRETRHHSVSVAPQLLQSHTGTPRGQNLNNGDGGSPSSPILEPNSIYNEPCDSKDLHSSTRRSGTRRASLTAGIYCDTEHHKAYDSSPRDAYPVSPSNKIAPTNLCNRLLLPPPAHACLCGGVAEAIVAAATLRLGFCCGGGGGGHESGRLLTFPPPGSVSCSGMVGFALSLYTPPTGSLRSL
ncbi:unnamed protein product [Schistocephalus solidus]|uniref:Uncharacterized protein n=1 Tax=Schistocephalus solidus TaxID=70667 RepID=A0A183TLW0_SCHSO|nr:unnamed protein product [Schistocephalus solidus]